MSIQSSIVFFPCSDIEATHRFYTEVMGLRLHQSQSGGLARIYDTGYGYWGFVEYKDGRTAALDGMTLSLNCESCADVDRLHAQALSRGAQEIAPPQRHGRFAVYSSFIRDPDGRHVELQYILE